MSSRTLSPGLPVDTRSAPVPLRTLVVSAAALAVPLAAQAAAPEMLVQYELLLWLLALVPAFLLAYQRGWRGAANALACGMALLSVSQAILAYLGQGVRDWTLMLLVVVVYLAASAGIGWVTELLHRERERARRGEAQALGMAGRLQAVAAAAAGVAAAGCHAELDQVLRSACGRAIPFAALELDVLDSDRGVLRSLRGENGDVPCERPLEGMAAEVVRSRRSLVIPPAGDRAAAIHTPVQSSERVLGVLAVYSVSPGGYAPEDVQVLEAVAALAAAALQNLDAARLAEAAGRALREGESRLRESEERYRRFFDNDLTGDYLADADGTLLDCNRRFAQIFGFEAAGDARGTSLLRLHMDPAAHARMMVRVQVEGGLREVELEMRRRDGGVVHALVNVVGIYDDQGRLSQMLGYVFDATGHKRVEEQLRQSQKMEAVGQLAGGVAHDFNNVLTVIIGFASLLEQLVEDNPRASSYVQEIQKAADRTAELTQQLLAFARRQVLRPELLGLNDVLADAERMLRRLIPESIAIQTRLSPDAGAVRVDPTQLQQVLLNLAANARDAMPQGGLLRIATRAVQLTETDAARFPYTVLPGRYAALVIGDSGHGMPPEVVERVFEPFYTTKEPGKGTGLGLSTVYGIVKQSGGYIFADSKVGEGSTFVVLFPREEVPSSAAVAPAGPLAPLGTGRGTVLLAEDEDAVRELSRQVLEQAGYSVLVARDGEEALRLAEAHGSALDALIADVVMPRLGGARLAERLRERQPGLKVILVSGYAGEALTRGGEMPEDCVFLQKPFAPRLLAEATRELLVGAGAGASDGDELAW